MKGKDSDVVWGKARPIRIKRGGTRDGRFVALVDCRDCGFAGGAVPLESAGSHPGLWDRGLDGPDHPAGLLGGLLGHYCG